ncbi:43kDa postsynaptic protein [Fagus crenata]
MSQLGVILQESVGRERETRTILCFLREQMDGVDGTTRRRRSLKDRLRFKGIGCCGATWVFGGTTVGDNNDEEDEEVVDVGQGPSENNPDPDCVGPVSSGSGMNLAAALAAERQFRASSNEQERDAVGPNDLNGVSLGTVGTAPGTPLRVSLMRLLEETDGGDEETIENEKAGTLDGVAATGNDSMCCVCMVRKKGAAFIPCGHTFCRVCSRELWLNRGSCPLCNRSILEILDIF